MKDYVFFDQPAVKRLMEFIKAGGPEESEYEEMTMLWDAIDVDCWKNGPNNQLRERLVCLFGNDFLHQTIQGHCFRRPHGYAGDYQIIDHLYQQKITGDKRFEKWDRYMHSLHAARAVRNRKKYFIELIKTWVNKMPRPLRVLNIACGPCRDVQELLQVVSSENLNLHCVDLDSNAIEYAKYILGKHVQHVKFSRANIFKFETEEKFDLIWSAGLFDYFDDENFKKVLSKIYSWCGPLGEVVIGNFAIGNPTRAYMEKASDWFLYHRTKEELGRLALGVANRADIIEVKSEPLSVNLFLHIQRNGTFVQ